jgi:hypothetical protein
VRPRGDFSATDTTARLPRKAVVAVASVERRLVLDGYLADPDFDRWYPVSAVMSLLTTPPPAAYTP